MNKVELLIEDQKKKVLNNLFIEFHRENILGREHSLADCDFLDSNRCFPEEWIESFGIKIMDAVPKYWFKEDQDIALEQIKKRIVIFKNYSWDAVSVEYFNKYQSGFFYMNEHTFKFYLCSWITLYCKCSSGNEKINEFSARFFRKFSESFLGSSDSWRLSLNESQIHVIIDFLIFVVMSSPNDRFLAQECLRSGWLDYDKYGMDTLQHFNEEKMIQDFIDRG